MEDKGMVAYKIVGKNKYAKECFICKKKVEKEEGLLLISHILTCFSNHNKQVFLTAHKECEEKRNYILKNNWYEYYGLNCFMHNRLESELQEKGYKDDTSYYVLSVESAYRKQKQWEE